MSEFKKEPRYVVFKIKDIHAYLSAAQIGALQTAGETIATGRAIAGKPPFNAVVVEQDWPEFEMVWDAIEARMTANARVQPPQVGWNEVLGVLLNGEETMDFADAMNQLTAHMEVTQWTPKGLVGFPDLTGFERQDTDMPLLPVEYVKQSGCADYGFHGTIFFPTPYPNGDGGFLHLQVEYHD